AGVGERSNSTPRHPRTRGTTHRRVADLRPTRRHSPALTGTAAPPETPPRASPGRLPHRGRLPRRSGTTSPSETTETEKLRKLFRAQPKTQQKQKKQAIPPPTSCMYEMYIGTFPGNGKRAACDSGVTIFARSYHKRKA